MEGVLTKNKMKVNGGRVRGQQDNALRIFKFRAFGRRDLKTYD